MFLSNSLVANDFRQVIVDSSGSQFGLKRLFLLRHTLPQLCQLFLRLLCIVVLAVDEAPRDGLELAIGSLETLFVDLFVRDDAALQQLIKQQIVVHRLHHDFSDTSVTELDKGVVLGGTSGAVSGQAQAGDFAKLSKVFPHFVFVEAVRNTSDVNDGATGHDDGGLWLFCNDGLAGGCGGGRLFLVCLFCGDSLGGLGASGGGGGCLFGARDGLFGWSNTGHLSRKLPGCKFAKSLKIIHPGLVKGILLWDRRQFSA